MLAATSKKNNSETDKVQFLSYDFILKHFSTERRCEMVVMFAEADDYNDADGNLRRHQIHKSIFISKSS